MNNIIKQGLLAAIDTIIDQTRTDQQFGDINRDSQHERFRLYLFIIVYGSGDFSGAMSTIRETGLRAPSEDWNFLNAFKAGTDSKNSKKIVWALLAGVNDHEEYNSGCNPALLDFREKVYIMMERLDIKRKGEE